MIDALMFALSDEPGALYSLLDVLAERNVNVQAAVAMNGLAPDTGLAVLVCEPVDVAMAVLNERNFRYYRHDAFAVGLADEPGRLANVARLLGEAGVGIRSLYHSEYSSHSGLPLTIFSVTDNTAAMTTLRSHGVEVLEHLPPRRTATAANS